MQSIFDRIKQKQKERRELTEKERQEVSKKVLEAIHTTSVQREIYAMRAQDAIAKARRAAAQTQNADELIENMLAQLSQGLSNS